MPLTERVLEVGPGTPAGTVLRRVWQPVALGSDLTAGTVRRLRVLGEDLTLYRGTSGQVYLVGGRCAHRSTWLHTGWVEDDCLRCFYHGWKYDGAGQCIEQPAEKQHFAKSVAIPSYPVREYAGLVFAYLGPESPPALPRHPELDASGVTVVAGIRPPGIWPANYFQLLENGVDPVHTAFVHRESEPHWNGVPDVTVEEIVNGIEVTASRPGYERKTHYYFPNLFRITVFPRPDDTLELPMYLWTVPIDTMRSMFISAMVVPPGLRGRLPGMAAVPGRTPMTAADGEALLAGGRRPASVTEEDYMAMIGQGAVADRVHEHLGRSDVGVILLRKLWQRALSRSDGRRRSDVR